MKISKITLEHASKGDFRSCECDGLCHTKVLPYLSIAQAIEGSYDIQLGNGKVHNTAERGFFIAPSNVRQIITHKIDPVSGNMHCRWVFLKIKINDAYTYDAGYCFPVILLEPYKTRLNDLFDRLFSVTNVFSEYVCYYEIVKLLSEVALEENDRAPYFIEDALIYIKENYKKKITVLDIAKTVNISPSHLFSSFKKQTGVAPICFLNNYRLSIATEQLLNTNKTIAEIAADVGIGDSVYFNKLFKKCYQMAPTEYRKTHKPNMLSE